MHVPNKSLDSPWPIVPTSATNHTFDTWVAHANMKYNTLLSATNSDYAHVHTFLFSVCTCAESPDSV